METRTKRQHDVTRLLHLVQFATLLLLTLFLANCASRVKRDGPPPFPVDVSKIPNAIPRPEPLSKYNLPVYRVKGKTYYTLKSSKHFEEVGIASWYGTLFHERRTSSGERYNMLAMTAAHKTLPLPTYVEVFNLKNKRKIIVKVNDRGPFKDNRIIDLSYVAAKKLGITGHGTAQVKIRALDPYVYQRNVFLAKNQVKHHEKTRYLAVGTFKNRLHAMRLKERLGRALNTPVLITENKNAHYLVQIGPLTNAKSEALLKKRLLKMKVMT